MNICNDKNKCCCFTGHRPHKLGISEKKAKELLSDAVDDMIKKGYTVFISGMAQGIDMWAAEIVLEKRKSNPQIFLVCASAYKGMETKWQIDEKRMYELMQNLITNAVHYNKVGGQIEVTLEETDKSAIIKVKDTGIGIAEENIPHLCERFYRVDKSRSKKTGGTGLGLAIVKHICALYGAEIVINSEIDVGTEFIVVFKKDK